MKRTQLYLDEQVWDILHTAARKQRTTVSELVREAVRERYLGQLNVRKKAMQEFVGIRKQCPVGWDTERFVRGLRRGSRIDKLGGA